jgi:hypothetical protein
VSGILRSRAGRAGAGLVLLAGVASVGGALPAATAAGQISTPRLLSFTVELASAHPARLAALAAAHNISATTRASRLADVLPSAAQRATVRRSLIAAGFHITGVTKFSITATGSSRAAVPTFSPRLAVGVVSNRLPVLIPIAHSDPFEPTPTNGSIITRVDNAPLPTAGDPVDTIATIQFSGWHDANLASFATANHLADPLTNGQYTQVSVDGDSVSKDNGGSDEVALDEESLLETSPHSNLRAYFVGETTQDFVDALDLMASQAAANHIVAMSDSWGNCEPEIPSATMNTMNTAIEDLLAAGVTTFSGSGDNGAYDCSTQDDVDDHVAVDFPPSDPLVIAVGGTTVDAHNLAAPVQHTWWTPSGKKAPKFLGQGSGGGFSIRFAKPSYQDGVLPSSQTKRALPDISLEADPESGFTITNDGRTEGGNGGTSLAGPLAAATLTNTLEVNRVSAGIGDILPALYAAPSTDFSDITVGSNGAYKARHGYDEATGLGAPLWNKLAPVLLPTFSLGVSTVSKSHAIPVKVVATGSYTGWFSGAGTVAGCSPTGGSLTPPTSVPTSHDGSQNVWVAAATASTCTISEAKTSVDTVAPVAHVRAVLLSKSRHVVGLDWTAKDASPSTGIDHYRVAVTRVGGRLFARLAAAGPHPEKFQGAKHAKYRITVQAVDKAGNVSAVASTKIRDY